MAQAKKRSPMKVASERMRMLGEGLRSELENWPGVTVKGAFGMKLVYRGETVFAALPDTKAIYHEDAIMLKFAEEKPALVKRMEGDPHFISAQTATGRNSKSEGRKWRFFFIFEGAHFHPAPQMVAGGHKLAPGPKTSNLGGPSPALNE